MYLLLLMSGMVVSYFAVALVLSQLLKEKIKINPRRAALSIVFVVLFTVIAYYVAVYLYKIDAEFSNRFLHAIGGAFNFVLLTFLVVKDFKMHLNRVQFVIITILLVGFFGIANEVLEYFAQVYFHYYYSTTPLDTWLDLISNLVGAGLGVITFVYFIKEKTHQDSQD